jgi:hypothetical protein
VVIFVAVLRNFQNSKVWIVNIVTFSRLFVFETADRDKKRGTSQSSLTNDWIFRVTSNSTFCFNKAKFSFSFKCIERIEGALEILLDRTATEHEQLTW